MRRVVPLVLACLAPLAFATTAGSQTSVPQGFRTVSRAQLDQGVEYQKLTNESVPVIAHVAHIDPGAPVDLRVVNSRDSVPNHGATLEQPSSMCRRVGCVVAVNGDFHGPTSEPVGGVVSGGRMLRSPFASHPQLTLTRDGHLVGGAFDWSGTLRSSDAATLSVSGVNVSRGADDLVVYTPAWGKTTGTVGGVELVATTGDPVGALNRPTSLQLVGLRIGAGPIPAKGVVLSGDGTAADLLTSLWDRIQSGAASPQVELRIQSTIDAVESLGALPVILHNGRRAYAGSGASAGLLSAHDPRTLVGWNGAGDVFLVTIDGRQTTSKGMTMAEAADLLLGLGATEAVNLDGGGGSTFVVDGLIWNTPSDGSSTDPSAARERGAANSFAVLPRGGAAPDPVFLAVSNPGDPPDPTSAESPDAGSVPAPDGPKMTVSVSSPPASGDDPHPTPVLSGVPASAPSEAGADPTTSSSSAPVHLEAAATPSGSSPLGTRPGGTDRSPSSGRGSTTTGRREVARPGEPGLDPGGGATEPGNGGVETASVAAAVILLLVVSAAFVPARRVRRRFRSLGLVSGRR